MGGASSSSLSDNQLKSRLQGMDDYDFEHLIADLWERQGWRATVKQQSVDRGVDVVAERDDPFPQKWLIQAKCYSGTLGGPDVRQYVSLQHRPGVDGAIVVSSGPFSKQARQEEKEHNLKLMDGDALVSLIRDTGSYDLVDQYITVESSVGSQVSEQSSFDSSYSSESSSSDFSDSSEPVSSDLPEQEQYQKESEGGTRLHKYLDDIENGSDAEEAIIGIKRIFFEEPPRSNWWKAIIGATGVWVSFFLVPSSLLDGVLGSILGFGVLIGWPLMPIALYMDSKVAPKYTVSWEPYRWLYILGSLIPFGGVVAGPVYLARRWWYGTNREIDNVEEIREDFKEGIELARSAARVLAEDSEDVSVAVGEYALHEYGKHEEFLDFVGGGRISVKLGPIQDFSKMILAGFETGYTPEIRYPQVKNEMQDAVENNKILRDDLEEISPSSEFENTAEMYEEFLDELERLNSKSENLIRAAESDDISVEMVEQTIDATESVEDLTIQLSRSLDEDVRTMNAFRDSLEEDQEIISQGGS